MDAAAARAMNELARRTPGGELAARTAAGWLAAAEVLLLVALAARGQTRTALRTLVGVAAIYVLSEGLGRALARDRPFAKLQDVQELLEHRPGRSFPSRHVASAVAMSRLATHADPTIGRAMGMLAWLLAISRVAAGLHYPSDVVAGALVGAGVAESLRMLCVASFRRRR